MQVPYFLGDVLFRNNPVLVADEEFKQRIFLGCKADELSSTACLLGIEIELNIGVAEQVIVGGFLFGPAERYADAREQFLEVERLYQIVIAACIEAADLVGGEPQGSEHDHRHLSAILANAFAQIYSVYPGNNYIHDNEIETIVSCEVERGLTVISQLHLVAFFLETFLQRICCFYLVLY